MPAWSLPQGFQFGVATAGFQVEGGFNGPGEPQNNWARWEHEGRIEPSGRAVEFWDRYEDHLDRAAGIGLDSFRLSVEWARCEPTEGAYDDEAFAHYARILDACRARGLEPLVTLHHFTHPAWLGEDFWLHLDSYERFERWADEAVRRLSDHCRNWITINEPNILGLNSWITGVFPPGQMAAIPSAIRAIDHMLTAHVRAYGVIKSIQPDSCVSVNPYSLSIYELDRLGSDLLAARAYGVDRDGLRAWLEERRRQHAERVPDGGVRERALRRFTRQAVPLELAFPRTLTAVFESPHERTLDVAQLDYYDPAVGRKFRLPGHRTAGGRSTLPFRQLWDDPVEPAHLVTYAELTREPGLDVWVVENGLCNRVRDGQAHHRLDGWNRPRYLRANLGAVVDGLDAGIPLGGYWHWTLVDNYEWGSYEPRFGVFGVNRTAGVEILEHDAMGDDAAGAYRRIVEGLRAGDRSVVDR